MHHDYNEQIITLIQLCTMITMSKSEKVDFLISILDCFAARFPISNNISNFILYVCVVLKVFVS